VPAFPDALLRDAGAREADPEAARRLVDELLALGEVALWSWLNGVLRDGDGVRRDRPDGVPPDRDPQTRVRVAHDTPDGTMRLREFPWIYRCDMFGR
jgi:hypothetical protein